MQELLFYSSEYNWLAMAQYYIHSQYLVKSPSVLYYPRLRKKAPLLTKPLFLSVFRITP